MSSSANPSAFSLGRQKATMASPLDLLLSFFFSVFLGEHLLHIVTEFAKSSTNFCGGWPPLIPINFGHPPLTFLNRELIFGGFFLRGQEVPPNSAVDPTAGPEDVADCNHTSRLDRRDFPPLRLLRKSLYSVLYWAGHFDGVDGEHCLEDVGLAITS